MADLPLQGSTLFVETVHICLRLGFGKLILIEFNNIPGGKSGTKVLQFSIPNCEGPEAGAHSRAHKILVHSGAFPGKIRESNRRG